MPFDYSKYSNYLDRRKARNYLELNQICFAGSIKIGIALVYLDDCLDFKDRKKRENLLDRS